MKLLVAPASEDETAESFTEPALGTVKPLNVATPDEAGLVATPPSDPPDDETVTLADEPVTVFPNASCTVTAAPKGAPASTVAGGCGVKASFAAAAAVTGKESLV